MTSIQSPRRRIIHSSLIAMLMLLSPQAAQATAAPDYRPTFHPETLKGPPAGVPNRVVVLGTGHLAEFGETPSPALLAPLLDRLAAWRPTAIATEDLSGLTCDSLRRYPARYAETARTYCPDPTAGGRATGLDVPAANAEAERLLAGWPATPSSAQRRHLAAVFLAAGEPGSALVQWLRLAQADRRAGDGLDAALVALLVEAQTRRNETDLLSAVLAARLGLDRLWSVDDHSADTPDSADPAERKAAGDAVMHAWDNPVTKTRMADDARLKAAVMRPGGMLALYRAYNAPAAAMTAYRSDFGAALAEPSRQGYGRQYVGYWETRNLRMVANIRDVIGQRPGTRLLAIVGASHKGYYEAYLNQMHDVRLDDPMTLLR